MPSWPKLPASGFIKGRPATEQDVREGNAIFYLKVHGAEPGIAVQVPIPQFAYWTNETGEKIPVVVIQAEESDGDILYGFRDAEGTDHIGTRSDLELIGTPTRPPEQTE